VPFVSSSEVIVSYMKITFILPCVDLSGGVRVTATYAEHLKQRGHEVNIISTPPHAFRGLQDQVRSILKGRGWIPKATSGSSHFDNIDVSHQIIDHSGAILDTDVPDADVVIATWWETAKWVANLSNTKGAKVYFIQHHEVFDYLPQERTRASYRLPLHKITTSQWLVDLMGTEYGDRYVSLIPNSVDLGKFFAPPRGKQVIPTVGMIYSLTPWKGCDQTLKAFSLASQNIPNLRLITFGTHQLSSDLPLPINSSHTCQPTQENIRKVYSQCDAWLFGSQYEGFGLPLLEAMACRTPVIGTPAGAAPELLADRAGILVKPNNPEDMANGIEQICRMSEKEWRIMSDIAYKKSIQYTWDDATLLFEEALYTAIKRTRQGDLQVTSSSRPVNQHS